MRRLKVALSKKLPCCETPEKPRAIGFARNIFLRVDGDGRQMDAPIAGGTIGNGV